MDPLNERLAANLERTFEDLVRGHQDRLYSLAARYLGNTADAEDVTQEAFVRAYRAMASYPPARIHDLDLRPWLTTILLNVARNRARPDRARTTTMDALATLRADPAEAPEAATDRREAAERWAALVASLPAIYRAPVLLRHLDGCSYGEMAGILGRAEGTLKAQVHRGVELLRAAFEADDRRPPPAMPVASPLLEEVMP